MNDTTKNLAKIPAPKKSELKERMESFRIQIGDLIVRNLAQDVELKRLRQRMTDAHKRLSLLDGEGFESEAGPLRHRVEWQELISLCRAG